MFAVITTVLMSAGFAERVRIGPALLFMFCWQTIVYSPIACWTWNSNGWLFTLGAYDFAGGSPVHISSGTAAAAIALYLGKRKGYGTARLAYKPHSTFYIVLGTVFLWVGWAGFNGGSGLGANLRGGEFNAKPPPWQRTVYPIMWMTDPPTPLFLTVGLLFFSIDSSSHGHRRYQHRCRYRWTHLDAHGLETREEMVDCWILVSNPLALSPCLAPPRLVKFNSLVHSC